MKPLFDRLIIAPTASETFTPGGLVIPEQAQEKSQKGRIQAIGPDVKYAKEGDYVLYGKYAGSEVEVNQTKLMIVREEEIICILDDSEI